MRMKKYSVVSLLLLLLILVLRGTSMNPSDCWNEDKLNSMNADGDEHDKNLSKFNMMVKCLMQERSPGGGGGSGGIDWNQFNNIANSGRFPPKKNKPPPQPPNQQQNNNGYHDNSPDNRRNRNRDYYERNVPPKQDWIRPGSNRNPGRNSNNNNNQMGNSQQPRPGVHPEDWNNEGMRELEEDRRDSRFDNDNTPLWGQPSDRGYNNQNNNNKKEGRKRNNNRRKQGESKRIDPPRRDGPLDTLGNIVGNPVNVPNNNNINLNSNINNNNNNNNPNMRGPDGDWRDGELERRPFEEENPFISADFGGDANLSLHRKYGYAVMAMSVVVLAVLMVSTIFCCNSSNSTMSQPAVAGIAQLDNYSLYSYKQGMVLPVATSDTLRSGTIRSSMRTDTLRSSGTTQQFRSSPQYRVSDIDPDFARRYKDEAHY